MFQLTKTNLGWLGVLANEKGVVRVVFGHRTKEAARTGLASQKSKNTNEIEADPSKVALWLERLVDWTLEPSDDLSDIPVDLSSLSPFTQRVLSMCRTITPGETTTYGALAKRCRSEKAARAVGTALAHNPVPLIIPCHRVLRAGGGLGGFSAPRGVAMKSELLKREARLVECHAG